MLYRTVDNKPIHARLAGSNVTNQAHTHTQAQTQSTAYSTRTRPNKHIYTHTNTKAHAEMKLNAESAPSFAFCCRCFGWWLVAAQFQYEKPVECAGGVSLQPRKISN